MPLQFFSNDFGIKRGVGKDEDARQQGNRFDLLGNTITDLTSRENSDRTNNQGFGGNFGHTRLVRYEKVKEYDLDHCVGAEIQAEASWRLQEEDRLSTE